MRSVRCTGTDKFEVLMAFIESLIEESFLGVLDTNQRSIITDMFAQARLRVNVPLHGPCYIQKTRPVQLSSPRVSLSACVSLQQWRSAVMCMSSSIVSNGTLAHRYTTPLSYSLT